MERYKDISWIFTCCFFIFLSIFISVKFIFIFFLKAAYEPSFIFEMTPLHLLSGINSLQLIFLSLLVILFDTYLHVKATRRNLIYSYLPTILVLAGLGLSMMLNEINTSYILHYVIFGFFLAILLIDHRRILTLPVSPKKEQDRSILEKKTPSFLETKNVTPIYETSYKQPKIITATTSKNFEVKDESAALIKNVQALFDQLQLKTKKLEVLENNIEERRKKLIEQENLFKDYLKSYVESTEKSVPLVKDSFRKTSDENQVILGEKIKDNLIIDNETDCVAIIQRGILKKINNCFANMLGYQPEELVNKSLFAFIASDGIDEVKKHYLRRLKDVSSGSYKTVFLKKDDSKLLVEVTVESVVYDGENAEIIVIKQV